MADSSNAPRIFVFGNLGSAGILLAGIAAVILASAFVVRTLRSPPGPAQLPQLAEQTQPHENHEFQLIQLGEMRRDQFLLDKSTGRVWSEVCNGQVSGPDCNGQLFWQEMKVEGVAPASGPTSIFPGSPMRPQKSR